MGFREATAAVQVGDKGGSGKERKAGKESTVSGLGDPLWEMEWECGSRGSWESVVSSSELENPAGNCDL